MKKKKSSSTRSSQSNEKHPFLFAFIVAGILIATLIILMRAAQMNQDTRSRAARPAGVPQTGSGFYRVDGEGKVIEVIPITDAEGKSVNPGYRGGPDSPQAKAYKQVCGNKPLSECFVSWLTTLKFKGQK